MRVADWKDGAGLAGLDDGTSEEIAVAGNCRAMDAEAAGGFDDPPGGGRRGPGSEATGKYSTTSLEDKMLQPSGPDLELT